jgi:hypothetical protein
VFSFGRLLAACEKSQQWALAAGRHRAREVHALRARIAVHEPRERILADSELAQRLLQVNTRMEHVTRVVAEISSAVLVVPDLTYSPDLPDMVRELITRYRVTNTLFNRAMVAHPAIRDEATATADEVVAEIEEDGSEEGDAAGGGVVGPSPRPPCLL